MKEKIKRMTTADLFNGIWKIAKEAGEFEKLNGILEYSSACDYKAVPISNYEWDFRFAAKQGSNEGIYIDGFIVGVIDESGTNKEVRICTIKTCSYSLEAMKIMSEACGILTWYGERYVSENLHLFEPEILRDVYIIVRNGVEYMFTDMIDCGDHWQGRQYRPDGSISKMLHRITYEEKKSARIEKVGRK